MWFGPGVRSIVEGETRFSKIGNFKDATPGEAVDLKALDLQQLFLAMTEEVLFQSLSPDLTVRSAFRADKSKAAGPKVPHPGLLFWRWQGLLFVFAAESCSSHQFQSAACRHVCRCG